ncbi:MAG: hypothetical protein IKN43_06745 [Selenomonadaceae bacterium]|nr:hypothetical protein [Selenomonadaceae bacterium]
MFELFDTVKIKSNGIIGTIIDKTEINGKARYIVENDTKGEIAGAYGGNWAEFDCLDEDLLKVG